MLKKSNGRIVATSSIFHWLHSNELDSLLPQNSMVSYENVGFWRKLQAYGNSKLLQIFMCFELQRRHPDVGCTPVAPGLVKTKMTSLSSRDADPTSDDWNFAAVDAPSGAQTSVEVLLGNNVGASPNEGGPT